jgi:hypothetical protein
VDARLSVLLPNLRYIQLHQIAMPFGIRSVLRETGGRIDRVIDREGDYQLRRLKSVVLTPWTRTAKVLWWICADGAISRDQLESYYRDFLSKGLAVYIRTSALARFFAAITRCNAYKETALCLILVIMLLVGVPLIVSASFGLVILTRIYLLSRADPFQSK